MDKRLMTVIMVALLFAAIITTVFYKVTSGSRDVRAEVLTKELVVATKELPLGSVITPEDVRVVDFPQDAYPEQAFENIDDVVDRSVINRILPNEPILSERVTDKGAGFGLAPLIPDGMRALAIAVNQVSGVSGFIHPSSKVDVLLTGSPVGQKDRATTTVLENVSVLSTGQRTIPNANGQAENVPVVNVLVSPEDAEKLTLATAEGRIQLVLRNPSDENNEAAGRRPARSADLFRHGPPRQASPRPRVVRAPAPPPPAVIKQNIEMIRGNKRSTESFTQPTG